MSFSPLDIPGCQLWLDAGSLSVDHANGDEVTTWHDSSGHGRDFTEGGTGTTVKYNTNVLNGNPGVRFFDASQKYLTGPDLSGVLPSAVTMFIVWKMPVSQTIYFIFQDGSDFRDGYWADADAGYFTPFRTARIVNYPAHMPQDTAGHHMSLWSSGSTYRAFLDGIDQGAQSASFKSGTQPCFNVVATNNGAAMPGHVCEFLLYDNITSDIDRWHITNYHAIKYNLSPGPQPPGIDSIPLGLFGFLLMRVPNTTKILRMMRKWGK